MTIRLRLTLTIGLLFAGSLSVLGYLIVSLQRRQLAADNEVKVGIIVSTVRRAAADALLQKDDLLLLSYVKFLREQFPELAAVRVNWIEGGRRRSHLIGKKDPAMRAETRGVKVRDPRSKNRRVLLELLINRDLLDARAEEELARLRRNLMRLFGVALLLTLLFSDWFARGLTRPLAALARAAREIGRGKLGTRLEWKSADEVGSLVEGFNRMSGRLEELDRMKKDFVSGVTHELRSPLGAIDSFLSLMRKKMVGGVPSDPKQFADYFKRIQANVGRLSGFINDLLDVAKIERGKMECTLRPTRIQEVAGDVVKFFEAKSRENGVALENKLAHELGAVEADPDRLRQVFVNLISNALKFTPRGGRIWIASEQFRENGRKFIEVSVGDTGRGMSAADRVKLFEKFSQGKNIDTGVMGPKGTGLGLYIVKSIVESHGGKVEVKSEPGRGTQFLFNLRMS